MFVIFDNLYLPVLFPQPNEKLMEIYSLIIKIFGYFLTERHSLLNG